jgi:hypothetical protein
VLPAERSYLHVELDYEGTIKSLEASQSTENRRVTVRQYSKYTKNNEEHNLKEMPISIIRDLEQYQFSCPERIHGLIDSMISL